VGRLHDEIKALPDQLAPLVSAIENSGRDAQFVFSKGQEATIAILKKEVDAARISIANFTALEKASLRDAMKAAIYKDAGAAVADAVRSLQVAGEEMHKTAQTNVRSLWIAAAGGGLVCGVVLFALSYLFR
jgi:hypothetical protein